MHNLPSLPVIVATLIAALGSFSRVLDATKPGWGRLPGWLQVLLPSVVTALGAFIAALAHVATPTDLVVAFVAALMLLGPGIPSHRSSAPLPSNPKPPILPLILFSLCFGAIVILCGACSETITPKTVLDTEQDVAKVLCEQYFTQKAGLSVADVEKGFCSAQQLVPWVEQVVAAKQKAGVIAESRNAQLEGDAGAK